MQVGFSACTRCAATFGFFPSTPSDTTTLRFEGVDAQRANVTAALLEDSEEGKLWGWGSLLETILNRNFG